MAITKEELERFPCRDRFGNPTNQQITKSGHMFENGDSVSIYKSTNGYTYVPYLIDGVNRILYRLDFVMLATFKDIHDFEQIDPVHINGDIDDYSLSNLSFKDREELWKDVYVNSYQEQYQISNNGRLRNKTDNHIVKGSIFKTGYRTASLTTTKLTYHRMVGSAFVYNPKPDIYTIINHIDGDRQNNFDWNLEWCDQKINSVHAAIYGKMGAMSIEEIDMIRDKLLDAKFKGSSQLVYESIKEKHPHITLKMIYTIKRNKAYLHSKKYDLSVIKYPKYDTTVISTEILDWIRDLLIANSYLPTKVYNLIDHNKYPNITVPVIQGIKYCRKEYMRSIKYNINEIYDLFNSNKKKGKGECNRMKGIINNPNEVLDLCRDLSLTNTFHGSPRAIFNALNHNKYQNMSENILKGIIYNSSRSSPYYRSDRYNLDDYFDRLEKREFSAPSKELISRLIKSYSLGNSDITDSAYDLLLEEYLKVHGEDKRPFLRVAQTDSIKALVGSLSKLFGVHETMRPEQKSYVEWFNTTKLNEDLTIIVQPKFDGCSVAYDAKTHQYFKRGDYDNGESEEVTHIFKDTIFIGKKRVDEMCDGCKFELIMSKTIHKEFPMYETPRDATAAMMKKGTIASYGTLIPLREIIDGKQYVSPELKEISMITKISDFDSIQRFITDLLNEGAVQEFHGDKYMCDGVVVSVVNEDESIIKEVAIKILFDVHDTKLIDIIYQLGNTGKITPVAKITPTLVADGKRTVTNITLSNIKRIQDMQLRYNDTVRVMYNIVPYLIDSKHDGDYPINIPQKCPICGSKLDLSHPETVRCMNPECDGRRVGDITRYVVKMRMLGISKQTISKLYDYGIIQSIPDLYTLTKEKIMSVDGYKEKSAQNILDTIQIASQDCPVSRWLGALPFKDIDSKTWDIILNESFGNDELRKGNMIKGYLDMEDPEEFLYEVIMNGYFDGVGDAKKRSINEGWLRNFKMMQQIIPYITFRITTVSKSNHVKGYVTFTGCRDEELSKTLSEKGYETIDFGSKTEYLIIPNNDYSNNKTAKAKAKGITIITLDAAKNNFFE